MRDFAVARRTIVLPWMTVHGVATSDGVVALHVDSDDDEGDEFVGGAELEEAAGHLDALETQLEEYVDGSRRAFEVPLDLSRLRGFRLAALRALMDLPFGSTISYAGLADAAGRPRAHRAAASACSHNPITIVIPCHRVVMADGSLGGYGGRPELKRALLAHEGIQMP